MAGRILHERFVSFTVPVPAGTTSDNPVSVDPGITGLVLIDLKLIVPAGHAGLTGFRVDDVNTTILPYGNPSTWIVTDDDKDVWPMGVEVGSQLRLKGYNTDVIAHTFYGQLHVTDVIRDDTSRTQLVPIVAG